MTYSLCCQFHSPIRLSRYLHIANNDEEKAYSYYYANVQLAQSFLPIIHVFEVGLRNNLYSSMASYYNDSDWILKIPALDIGSIKGSNTRFTEDLNDILARLGTKKFPTKDRVLSETTLSFWAELFFSKYDDIIGNAPFYSFQNRQNGYNKKTCYDDLIDIREYRNRVCHHDTLFISRDANGDKIDLRRPKTIRNKMLSVMEQINPDLRHLARKFDRIETEINRIAAIA